MWQVTLGRNSAELQPLTPWSRQAALLYRSLPSKQVPKQKRVGRGLWARRPFPDVCKESLHNYLRAQLPVRSPVSTEKPTAPPSPGVWAVLSHAPWKW